MDTKEKRNQSESWDSSRAKEALRDEERSLDIGESGQFAPGGYYNQRGSNETRRRTIDDDIVPPARGSRLEPDDKRRR